MRLGKTLGLAVAGVALGALALAPGTQAGPARHLPCPRRGAEVIASDGLVRVYAYPPRPKLSPLPPGAGSRRPPRPPSRIEACLVRARMRMTLFDPRQLGEGGDSSRGFDGVEAIVGTLVAYSTDRQGRGSLDISVSIADLASRRILRELPVSSSPYAKASTRTRMTDFVLAPSGSAAWIDERTTWTTFRRPDTKAFVLTTASLGGQQAVLDESPYIGEASLSLSGGALTWWDGGLERSTSLP